MSEVRVVVPTWNAWPHLERCLDALARVQAPALEVVVVDDASGDGSAGRVAERFPGVRLVRLPVSYTHLTLPTSAVAWGCGGGGGG